ncbi:hypothetical protein ACFQVA_33525 [Actinomadura keratinilytica]
MTVGGALAAAHDPLLAGLREVVYRRSHPSPPASCASNPAAPSRTPPPSAPPSSPPNTPSPRPRWTGR